MRVLFDTHAFLWWVLDSDRLAAGARKAIHESDIRFLSAASVWEMANKFRLGKLAIANSLMQTIEDQLARLDVAALDVTVAHGRLAGLMTGAHRDPFDRMLIAQALTENLTLISNEQVFDVFGVKRLW